MTAAGVVLGLLAAGPPPCHLVSPYQPAQSVVYVRHGEAPPDYGNESKERVWFRLRNNTSCAIRIPAAAPVLIRTGPDGRPTGDLPEGQEVAMDVWVTDPATASLFVHPGGHMRSERMLPAGQSVTFGVAANLLKRGPVAVKFDYEWDQRYTVDHRVRIAPKDLPEDVLRRLEAVKDPPPAAFLSPSHPGRRLSGAPAHSNVGPVDGGGIRPSPSPEP